MAAQQPTKHICRDYRALYGACSEHGLLQRSLGDLSESGYHRMGLDGRIRFENATCRRGNFCFRKEKVPDSKISGYWWTGPKYSILLNYSREKILCMWRTVRADFCFRLCFYSSLPAEHSAIFSYMY